MRTEFTVQALKILWLLALLALFMVLARNVGRAATPQFRATKECAENGDAQAQYQLGRMYESGTVVRENYRQAVKWYLKAAEQNCAAAQYSLGRMYFAGESVRQDYRQARQYFRRAAAQGYSLAQNR